MSPISLVTLVYASSTRCLAASISAHWMLDTSNAGSKNPSVLDCSGHDDGVQPLRIAAVPTIKNIKDRRCEGTLYMSYKNKR